MSESILNKLKEVTIEDKQFTDQETGEIINYKQLDLTISFDGEDEIIVAKIAKNEGKSAYRLIKLADEQ